MKFFNTKNKWVAGVQAYNLLTAILVAHDAATNPESSLNELAPDILIHLVSAFNLRDSASILESMACMTLNIGGIGFIAGVTAMGCSRIPPIFNAVDVFNHALNTHAIVDTEFDRKPTHNR